MKTNESIWHIYSDGTRADIPFASEEDKLFGWNSIAICTWQVHINPLVITINDTHFHMLCLGNEENIDFFQNRLKQRLHQYFRKTDRPLGIHLSARPIHERTEILSTFMYVYRNCMDFYKKLPGEYPWGSGNLYFSEGKNLFKGNAIANLSTREIRMFFHTGKRIPKEWMIDASGRILPESFIDYRYTEDLFGSARAFIAFLYVRKEDEAAMKKRINQHYLKERSIQDLRNMAEKISYRHYRKGLKRATLEDRLSIAELMIIGKLSGKNASLAKALYLKPDDLQFLL